MPTFNAGNGAFTPAASAGGAAQLPNWNLASATAGVFGKIVQVGWGGQLTTSTGYRTRWVRPTAFNAAGAVALTIGFAQPNYVAAAMVCSSSYTTNPTAPTDPAGNLYATSWNAQGGLGILVHPLANPWWVSTGVLQGCIGCFNVNGVDANGSSYQVTWEE